MKLRRRWRKSQIKEGLILVSAMHITAGIYVNDAEDGLIADIDEWLEKLAPFRADYRHHRTGEDNGDSHLKSLLDRPPGRGAGHQRQARLRPLAAGLLRRVRRPAPQAGVDQGHRRVRSAHAAHY